MYQLNVRLALAATILYAVRNGEVAFAEQTLREFAIPAEMVIGAIRAQIANTAEAVAALIQPVYY